MSLSKSGEMTLMQKALIQYIMLLQRRPILVKSCSSAFTGGLGNLISQLAKSPEKRNYKSVLSFVIMGFCYIGPVSHYLYLLLEKLVPQSSSYVTAKRLLVERILFTPPLLLGYLYILFIIEGNSHTEAIKKVKKSYLALLFMNWRVWTIFQLINVNYVPPMFRVLFGNAVGLFWNIYLATKRR